jgi:hypothetical protein
MLFDSSYVCAFAFKHPPEKLQLFCTSGVSNVTTTGGFSSQVLSAETNLQELKEDARYERRQPPYL